MRKEIIIVIISLFCFGPMVSFAQREPIVISPYAIAISYDKTTNLIFPYAIKSVDRGTGDVLAQKAVAVDNILQLKAGSRNFRETNLTVITGDGHFYSFLVSYIDSPAVVNYSFASDSSETALLTDQPLSEASLEATANEIKAKHPSLHKCVRVQDMELSLDNILIKDGLVWLTVSLHNKSAIPFSPSYARFSLKEAKQIKRTASQESELRPVYTTPYEKVTSGNKGIFVFALRPFTIPQDKKLLIQLGEEESSRLLTLRLSHRLMHKIKTL